MKLKLAFGFLPYLLRKKPLPATVQGSSKYLYVVIEPSAPRYVQHHEEFHVAWWYAVTLLSFVALSFVLHPFFAAIISIHVDPLLGTLARPYKRFEESFAYAYAASKHSTPQRYVDSIARHDSVQSRRYGSSFGAMVRKRLKYFQ